MASPDSLLNPTRDRQQLSAVYFFIFIVLGLSNGIVGPTLPTLAAHTQATLGQISILFTAQAIGYLLGSAASGHWLDRWPAHPLLMAMMAVLGVSLIAAPFAKLLILLTLIFFIIGLSQSTVDVGGNALLVWVHGRNVGPYMNALHFFFGLGAFISPLLVVAFIDLADGTAWVYIILALMLLPAMLLLRSRPSPRNPVARTHASAPARQTHLALLISIMFFLFVGAELSFAGWIYTYALELGIADVVHAGYLTSLFWGALTLGRLVSIPLARYLAPARLLALDIGGQLFFMGLLLIAGQRSMAVWVVSVGFGFTIASTFPSLMSLAERHMPIHGSTTSWFLVSASLGVMSMPWIIGQLFERVGPQGLSWVLSAAIVMVAIIFTIFQLATRPPSASTPNSTL